MRIKQIITGNFRTNVYIAYDKETRNGVVIDPGGDAMEILRAVKKDGIEIKKILLTHTHIDHIGAVKEVKAETSAEVLAFVKERLIMSSAKNNLSELFDEPFTMEADGYLEAGDIIKVGENEFEVIHTPGHTPGSCCYHIKKEKKLFSGDTLFFESIGRTNFPHGNEQDIMMSITETLFKLPDNTDVYPGHGQKTTIEHEKDYNPHIIGRGYY